jgi:hypothetical protein
MMRACVHQSAVTSVFNGKADVTTKSLDFGS